MDRARACLRCSGVPSSNDQDPVVPLHAPGQMSFCNCVPAALPSVFQSSMRLMPSLAAKNLISTALLDPPPGLLPDTLPSPPPGPQALMANSKTAAQDIRVKPSRIAATHTVRFFMIGCRNQPVCYGTPYRPARTGKTKPLADLGMGPWPPLAMVTAHANGALPPPGPVKIDDDQ